MIAAIVHYFRGEPVQSVAFSLFLLGLIVVLGALMSSTIRFFSFKDIPLTKRMPSLSVIILALLVGAVVYFSRQTLLILTAGYTIHGPSCNSFVRLACGRGLPRPCLPPLRNPHASRSLARPRFAARSLNSSWKNEIFLWVTSCFSTSPLRPELSLKRAESRLSFERWMKIVSRARSSRSSLDRSAMPNRTGKRLDVPVQQ